MTQIKKQTARDGEQGNVLFLILIAVALFAALSYAVTQSSRSGGGNANEETNLVNSSQLTQYPAGVRTSIVRMIVSNGVNPQDLMFNVPSDMAACTPVGECVFSAATGGGGATYVQAPAEVMASGSMGTWHFNGELEIEEIGSADAVDFDGNEIIAFLPGIKSDLCTKLNTKYGITGDTNTSSDLSASYTVDMLNTYVPAVEDAVLGTATGAAGLKGQPFGCFTNNGTTTYVYYHVLIER
jgi:hypothetical protein